MARPIRMEKLPARRVDTFIGVRAEIIALRLQKVGRQPLGAEAVEVAQRACQRGRRNAVRQRCGADRAPARLRVFDRALELRVEQQVGKLRVLFTRLFDLAEDRGADDAAAAPHQRDAAVV